MNLRSNPFKRLAGNGQLIIENRGRRQNPKGLDRERRPFESTADIELIFLSLSTFSEPTRESAFSRPRRGFFARQKKV
jgi:hypothetical protein